MATIYAPCAYLTVSVALGTNVLTLSSCAGIQAGTEVRRACKNCLFVRFTSDVLLGRG